MCNWFVKGVTACMLALFSLHSHSFVQQPNRVLKHLSRAREHCVKVTEQIKTCKCIMDSNIYCIQLITLKCCVNHRTTFRHLIKKPNQRRMKNQKC